MLSVILKATSFMTIDSMRFSVECLNLSYFLTEMWLLYNWHFGELEIASSETSMRPGSDPV